MKETKNIQAKILFRFFSNVLDEWTVETMWAEIVDEKKGLYKLDNIPLYAPLASGDIVFAEFDENEKFLTYRKTIKFSDNSTVQVIILDKSIKANEIRKIFSELGCISEKQSEKYFAMEIPYNKEYSLIRQKLIELEENKIISYAESVLSETHQYEK